MVGAAHADSFAAKRMRKLAQRRAVDYTSTVVRYMQVTVSGLLDFCHLSFFKYIFNYFFVVRNKIFMGIPTLSCWECVSS